MAKPTGQGDKIIALRLKGLKYQQIKARLNCAISTISYHCNKHGLSDIGYAKGIISPEIQERIAKYAETHTIKDTALKFAISESTVKKYKKKKPKTE